MKINVLTQWQGVKILSSMPPNSTSSSQLAIYDFIHKCTHHKLFLVELSVFVTWHRDGDGLLVGVVIAGLGWNVVSRIQAVGFLGRDGQHGQHQLPLSSPDQVHHLLVGRSLYIYTITIENMEDEM